MRKVNQATVDLVKSFEGLYLKPYLDSIGKPTIGYGTTYYEDKTTVTMNDPAITEERAEQLLANALTEHGKYIQNLVKVEITDNQFGALTSFSYNVGSGNLQKSTLLKLVNTSDFAGAADQFLVWNKAGGQEVPGLTRRRKAERVLFLQQDVLSSCPTDEQINVKLEEIEKE